MYNLVRHEFVPPGSQHPSLDHYDRTIAREFGSGRFRKHHTVDSLEKFMPSLFERFYRSTVGRVIGYRVRVWEYQSEYRLGEL